MTPPDPLKAEAERLEIGTELYAVLDRLQIELDSATVADLTRWLEAREQLASHRGAQEALRAAADATGEMIDSLAEHPCDYIHTGEIEAWLRARADALAQPQETRTEKA